MRPPRSTGRRAVVGLVLTAVLSFALVGTAAYVVANRIARADALSEGLRTARGVGRAVFAPQIPAAAAGDRSAIAALDAAVASRRDDGTLLRVKVWRRDGTVLWSDDHSLIGRTYPLSAPVAAVFSQGRDYSSISRLSGSETSVESGRFPDLVEAYVPLTLANGDVVALEMYSSDARVRAAEDELSERLVTFALVALLVLAVCQLPVSIWLVRRTAAAQHDRDRMLGTVLVSSERERRLIAGHLHDNLVQELAGAAYLLDSRSPQGIPPETRRAMGLVTQTLYDAVDDLRDLLVELRPDELTSATLADLVATAAIRACPDQKVSVTADLDRPVPPEMAAFLYRCARECAVNVAKHAQATRVDITLASSALGIRLVVQDDGIGVPDPLPPARGHVGLALLRDAAADLGGSLHLRAENGTVVTVELPPV
ncbi:MAG TPA: ATP-binding protein [Mycobacteriales bacterium]|jgi:signal transduction histidine kinase|nr:ATP-binding protein [Mycobacteriales bacterium]